MRHCIAPRNSSGVPVIGSEEVSCNDRTPQLIRLKCRCSLTSHWEVEGSGNTACALLLSLPCQSWCTENSIAFQWLQALGRSMETRMYTWYPEDYRTISASSSASRFPRMQEPHILLSVTQSSTPPQPPVPSNPSLPAYCNSPNRRPSRTYYVRSVSTDPAPNNRDYTVFPREKAALL